MIRKEGENTWSKTLLTIAYDKWKMIETLSNRMKSIAQ
jgi:hypothetical protein